MNETTILSPTNFKLKRRWLMALTLAAFALTELLIGSGLLVQQPLLIGALIAPFGILALFRWMELGALLSLFFMLLLRIRFSTDSATSIPFVLVFVGGWAVLWLVKMALDKNIRIVRSRANLPTLLFMTVVLLSTFWANFLIDPQVIVADKFIRVQLATIAVTAASVGLVILCINLVRQTWIVKVGYWLTVIGSIYNVTLFIRENIASGGQLVKQDWDGSVITADNLSRVVNTAGIFPLWFCTLTLALLLKARDLNRWQKLLMLIALGEWLYRVFGLSLVRVSSWLPTAIGLLVVLFIYSRRWFAVFVVVVGLLVVLNFDQLYQATVVAKEEEGTLAGSTSRMNLWSQAFKVAQVQPFLGTGPAGYRNYYLTYYRNLALSTHNNYLDMLLQYGIIGFVLFCWLCITLIIELWNFCRLHPPDSFEYGFTLGALGGACGMLVAMWLGDWVIPFAYNQTITGFTYTGYNWLFIGLALSLGYIAMERKRVTAQPLETPALPTSTIS